MKKAATAANQRNGDTQKHVIHSAYVNIQYAHRFVCIITLTFPYLLSGQIFLCSEFMNQNIVIQKWLFYTCHYKSLKRPVQDLCVVRCSIWYHLYNLKNVKNTPRGVLILVKLQASAKDDYISKLEPMEKILQATMVGRQEKVQTLQIRLTLQTITNKTITF